MKNNTSGTAGVTWNKRDKRWQARLDACGETVLLKTFKNQVDAIKARLEAENKYKLGIMVS